MGIFPDAQGQLTLQSTIRSCKKFQTRPRLMVVLLSCKMKKIRSKIEALECSQHYTSIIRRARADNSGVGGGIWPKFELIKAFMHVPLNCKNEVDQIKNQEARVFTRFLPLKVYGDFSDAQGQLSPWSDLAEFRNRPRYVMDVLVTCQYEEEMIKKEALECSNSQHYTSIFFQTSKGR